MAEKESSANLESLVARIADGAVWIGGRTHTVVDGTLHWNEA